MFAMPTILCRNGWQAGFGIQRGQTNSFASFKCKKLTKNKILQLHLFLINLQAMVNHGRVELLAHPLSQKYLQMKWNSYGKYFHLANVLFYSIFLGFVTCFSSQLMNTQEPSEEFLKSIENSTFRTVRF